MQQARLVTALALSSALFWPLAGCGHKVDTAEPAAQNSAGGASAEKKTLTLAVIPKSTGGEFWETVEVGAATPPRSSASTSSGRAR